MPRPRDGSSELALSASRAVATKTSGARRLCERHGPAGIGDEVGRQLAGGPAVEHDEVEVLYGSSIPPSAPRCPREPPASPQPPAQQAGDGAGAAGAGTVS